MAPALTQPLALLALNYARPTVTFMNDDTEIMIWFFLFLPDGSSVLRISGSPNKVRKSCILQLLGTITIAVKYEYHLSPFFLTPNLNVEDQRKCIVLKLSQRPYFNQNIINFSFNLIIENLLKMLRSRNLEKFHFRNLINVQIQLRSRNNGLVV